MNFKRGANAVYKNDEKLELAKVVEKYKKLYDEEIEKKIMGKQNMITNEKGMLQQNLNGVFIRKQCGSSTLTWKMSQMTIQIFNELSK